MQPARRTRPRRSGTLRRLVALGLAGLIGLTGAGCGSSTSSETDTANSSGTATSDGDKKLSAHDKAVKFAECMRASGVPHFPDPDPKGELNFGVDVTVEVW